jgi:hypothetical protein
MSEEFFDSLITKFDALETFPSNSNEWIAFFINCLPENVRTDAVIVQTLTLGLESTMGIEIIQSANSFGHETVRKLLPTIIYFLKQTIKTAPTTPSSNSNSTYLYLFKTIFDVDTLSKNDMDLFYSFLFEKGSVTFEQLKQLKTIEQKVQQKLTDVVQIINGDPSIIMKSVEFMEQIIDYKKDVLTLYPFLTSYFESVKRVMIQNPSQAQQTVLFYLAIAQDFVHNSL